MQRQISFLLLYSREVHEMTIWCFLDRVQAFVNVMVKSEKKSMQQLSIYANLKNGSSWVFLGLDLRRNSQKMLQKSEINPNIYEEILRKCHALNGHCGSPGPPFCDFILGFPYLPVPLAFVEVRANFMIFQK